MIKAIAIDDEPRALEIIRNHAARISFLQLQEVFTNPFAALDYLNKNSVDLIFLDIKMPDLSGLEFLDSIHKGKYLVVFTTAHSEFALYGYEVEALDYLLKPFDFPRFLRSVVRAHDKLITRRASDKDFFFVSMGAEQRKIFIDDIAYVEANGNYVTYHVGAERIIVRSTVKDVVSLLPANNFIQVHKSYIIALSKIDKIQDNHIYIGDQRISIGANYKDGLMTMIGNR